MGHFLAVTAIRSDAVSEVVDAISAFMQSHEVKHEVVQGSSAPNDATDALVFAPANGWTVVLWPNYFNVHDFPLIRAVAAARGWLMSSVHVYDGDYWEHLALQGPDELHSYCSRPEYWEEEAERARVASLNPNPDALAARVGVRSEVLRSYLVNVDDLAGDDVRAQETDEFELADFWVFTDFWRQIGIVYPDPPENPAAIVRLSKWFSKRLPAG